jgi:phosphatidylglycerol---prolipoprotein diacylglyceryl transferase
VAIAEFHSTATPLAHRVLEIFAYFIGARLYWFQAKNHPRPAAWSDNFLILGSAVFGAMLGSKLLHVAEHFHALESLPIDVWLDGKSLLGGFLGGTLGVEIAKRSIGWTRSTGDAWVLPLTVGIVIGRIGCQVSGLWDQTYGNPTSLPWAWNYGDDIGRHPVAAYEIILVVFAYLLIRRMQGAPGQRFAALMAAYCAIRLGLEFLKPPFAPAAAETLDTRLAGGLTAIQWAAVAGLIYYGRSMMLLRRRAAKPD